MKAMYYAKSNKSGCCASYAVEGASMGEIMIQGTALLAVSIFVVRIIALLVLKG